MPKLEEITDKFPSSISLVILYFLSFTLTVFAVFVYEDLYYLIFLGVLVGVLLFEPKEILLFSFIFFIFFLSRGEESKFLLNVGDPASYLLDGISHAKNIFQADYHFPPLTSALSFLSVYFFEYNFTSFSTQLIALLIVFISFRLSMIYTKDIYLSLLYAIIISFSPIFIWYSKATYSEIFFQFLIVITIWIFSEKNVNQLYLFLISLILVFLAPFTRGTGILLNPIFIFFLCFGNILRQKKYYLPLLVLTASISNIAIYYFRHEYVYNWQIKKITGLEDERLILVILFILPMIAFFIGKLLNYSRIYANIFNTALQIALPAFLALDTWLYFQNNTCLLAFMIYHFGYGAILLYLLGIGFMIKNIKRELAYGYISTISIVYGILLISTNVTPYKTHDFWLYWHRYFFSENWYIFLFISLLGVNTIKNYFNTQKIFSIYLSTGLFLSFFFFNKEQIKTATSNSMFGDSTNIFEHINLKNPSKDYIVLNDTAKHHFNYSTHYMISDFLLNEGKLVEKMSELLKEIKETSRVNIFPSNREYTFIGKESEAFNIDELLTSSTDIVCTPSIAHAKNGQAKKHTLCFKIEEKVSGVDLSFSKGWHGEEEWGIWSKQKASLIVENKFTKGILLNIEFYPFIGEDEKRSITIAADNQNYHFNTNVKEQLQLAVKPGIDTIKFNINKVEKANVEGDNRLLGIGISHIDYEYSSKE